MKTVKLLPLLLCVAACTGEKDYDATGFFEAEAITLSSGASGKILSLDVQEGNRVEAGQVLGTVDTTALHLQKLLLMKQAQTMRRSRPETEKQAATIRSQINTAKKERARIEELLKDGAATRKSLDDVNAQIALLDSQLEATLSSLRISAATVDGNSSAIDIQVAQVEDQIEKCRITSPIGGTVIAKYAATGEMAVPGKSLLRLADMETVYLRAYFTSEQLADLRLGQQVKVFADFGRDRRIEYPGTIVWIASESEFTPTAIQTSSSRANLVYAVKIAVRNDGRIKLGLYGEVVLK